MKAVVYHRYGSPDVLQVREIAKPTMAEDGVLVHVRFASVNPVDWHGMTGTPYLIRLPRALRKPANDRLGVDFAGTVEAVGEKVTEFQPGDEVFGAKTGAFAEYVGVSTDRAVALKPTNVTLEQAAATPVAALTALQGLRDKGQLRPGQQVLVNGASGGVGTFAVQIAKALGAEVTGVCRTQNVDLVRSLGADQVIDYTQADFTQGRERYDLLLDIAGNRSWSDLRQVLKPRARLVIVGGPKTNRLLGPMAHVIKTRLAGLGSSQKIGFFIATVNKADLAVLRELLEAGKVVPVIDRQYKLSEIAEAVGYLGEGHARGKVTVAI